MLDQSSFDSLNRYRGWFYAAAIYNLVWGTVNVVFPTALFDLLGMPHPNYLPLWQVVGMLVLVYAPAYWWAARAPYRHRHLVLIGLLGKIMGPIGFAWAVLTGSLPLAFGWTIVTNDLVWWPAFFSFVRDASRQIGGVRSLLTGG